MRRVLTKIFIALLGVVVLAAVAVAIDVFSRKPLVAVRSTTHPSIGRHQCVDCHAPIADEWRQSYHFKSVTGPYWKDVREMGYMKIFDPIRKPCIDCHAPANVLDLPRQAADRAEPDRELGVECTPNLLRNARGIIPSARSDDPDMGVDCVSCHVSSRGITGSGRRSTDAHEVVADPRFQDPAVTSAQFCITCHGSAVHSWRKTGYAATRQTCLDCHMPLVHAPSVEGGPERLRRSHRFLADKDPGMLTKALDASIEVTSARQAIVRIKNRGVGHYLPSGGNWLLVSVRVYGAAGNILKQERYDFGREEALLFDFWPFITDERIAPGTQKEAAMPLPDGHGRVEAVIRYHDWQRVNKTLLKLEKPF